MIANDDELRGTRERIAYFEDILAQMRVTVSAELFPSMASGYRDEIEKMQREVLEFLTRHVSRAPAHVACKREEWLAIAQQRMAEVRTGKVSGIPASQVVKNLLAPGR